MSDDLSTSQSRTPRPRGPSGDSLADVLERVLETGVVVAGDIRVHLTDIELLTIQLRLVICSVDKAEQMGMDWWKDAHYLTDDSDDADAVDDSGEIDPEHVERLNERIASLEETLEEVESSD